VGVGGGGDSRRPAASFQVHVHAARFARCPEAARALHSLHATIPSPFPPSYPPLPHTRTARYSRCSDLEVIDIPGDHFSILRQDDRDMNVIVTALKQKLAPFGWHEVLRRDAAAFSVSHSEIVDIDAYLTKMGVADAALRARLEAQMPFAPDQERVREVLAAAVAQVRGWRKGGGAGGGVEGCVCVCGVGTGYSAWVSILNRWRVIPSTHLHFENTVRETVLASSRLVPPPYPYPHPLPPLPTHHHYCPRRRW
jgi:hypothetical protein